jgi:HEAT repeat protein
MRRSGSSKLTLVLIVMFAACFLQAQTPVDKSWSSLMSGATDKSAAKREKAIHALGLIPGDPKAQEMAETALSDENFEVRSAGAEALGQMGAKGSIPKLVAAISDKDVTVVLAATNALSALGDDRAYDVYYAMLVGERKSGESLVESQMKMMKDPKALAGMGIEAGLGFIPFAGAGYQVFKMARKDDSSPVRAAAAQKLVRDPDPKSGEALAKVVSDKKWVVRASVADAIAKREDPALLPAVISALDDENDNVKYNAAAAVIRLSKIQPAKRAE